MNRSIIGWIVAFVLAIAGSALAWVWYAGGSGEPSTALTTPTIVAVPTAETVGTVKTYVIDSSQSFAGFEIDEILRGSPNRVFGETDQVAGQIQIDLADLSAIQFSQIVINARTFTTDSERRDRAIRGPIILNSASDEFEFITLDVDSAIGLSGSVETGDVLSFLLAGDLTIKGVANKVTFEVSATVTDDSTIEGSVTTTVLRSDFGIGIPTVPGVADVSDEVALDIRFVAVAG
ncbi:MAG: YceI family protein [Acidimicrobiia bacterium]